MTTLDFSPEQLAVVTSAIASCEMATLQTFVHALEGTSMAERLTVFAPVVSCEALLQVLAAAVDTSSFGTLAATACLIIEQRQPGAMQASYKTETGFSGLPTNIEYHGSEYPEGTALKL